MSSTATGRPASRGRGKSKIFFEFFFCLFVFFFPLSFFIFLIFLIFFSFRFQPPSEMKLSNRKRQKVFGHWWKNKKKKKNSWNSLCACVGNGDEWWGRGGVDEKGTGFFFSLFSPLPFNLSLYFFLFFCLFFLRESMYGLQYFSHGRFHRRKNSKKLRRPKQKKIRKKKSGRAQCAHRLSFPPRKFYFLFFFFVILVFFPDF